MERGLGGNLDLMVSGSAALQPRLARRCRNSVMEGYGLTETSPVISVNDMRNGGLELELLEKLLITYTLKLPLTEKSFVKVLT
jgi:long-chain acyl-CoA synthetase